MFAFYYFWKINKFPTDQTFKKAIFTLIKSIVYKQQNSNTYYNLLQDFFKHIFTDFIFQKKYLIHKTTAIYYKPHFKNFDEKEQIIYCTTSLHIKSSFQLLVFSKLILQMQLSQIIKKYMKFDPITRINVVEHNFWHL